MRDCLAPAVGREVEHRNALVDRDLRVGRCAPLRRGQRIDGLLDVAVANIAHRREQCLLVTDARSRREHVSDVEQILREDKPFGGRSAPREATCEWADDEQARPRTEADRTRESKPPTLDASAIEPDTGERSGTEVQCTVEAQCLVPDEVVAPVRAPDHDRNERELEVHGALRR
jgi:hypothetical protein